MPIKFKQPEPPPEPTWWDRIGGLPGAISSAVRAGSGFLSGEGGPSGALTSGAGEAAAQLIGGESFNPSPTDPNSTLGKLQGAITEPVAGESPTYAKFKGFLAGALTPAARIAAAAGMGSVPMSSVIKSGKMGESALRGAAYSGVGEAGREFASGHQLDPTAIGSHGAFGALLNAGLSRLGGAKAPEGAPPSPPMEVQPTYQTGPGTQILGEKGAEKNLRPLRSITPTGQPTPPTDIVGGPGKLGAYNVPEPPMAEDVASAAKAAKARTAELMRDQANLVKVQKWRAAQDAAKQKAADEAAAAQRIATTKAGLEAQPPVVRESVSSPVTGGRESLTQTWKAAEEEAPATSTDATPTRATSANVRRMKGVEVPPEGTRAREVYDSWISRGRDHDTALHLATKDLAPLTPDPSDVATTATEPQIPKAATEAQVPPTANVTPEGAATAATPEPPPLQGPGGPTATYSYDWPEAGGAQYHVNDPEGVTGGYHNSTVGEGRLKELGIEVPPTPTTPPPVDLGLGESTAASAGAPAAEPTPQSPLAKLFKSPTDAVGSAYRAAKSEQGVNPLATRQLGISLQTEAQKAGLPTNRVPNLSKFLNDKISPEISDRITAAEPSVETAPSVAASQEPSVESPDWKKENLAEAQSRPTPAEGTYEQQYPGAIEEENKYIDALPKDPMERITLLDRLKRLATSEGGIGGNQKGAIDPALANLMGRMALGGAGGGIVGGMSGHPIAGAAIGALGGGLIGGGGGEALPLSSEALSAAKPGFDKGISAMNKIHNASMLSPLSVAKKLAGDIGGLSSAAIENPERAGDLWKAVSGGGLKEAAQTGMEAFHAPPPNVEEMSGLENLAAKGPLSWSGRAMAGLTAGTKNLMEQGGFTPEEQAYYTFTNTPETVPGQAMLRAQRSSQVIQHLAPFARLAINRLERGLERSPVGPLMQYASKEGTNPDAMLTSLKRAGIGTGVGLAAAGLTPEDFAKEHPTETALISALAGPYSLPVAAGMASQTSGKSPSAAVARTVSREIPGLRLVEDVTTSPPAALRNYLSGYTNMLRPIAEGIAPGSHDPDVSGGIFDKAISNVPILNEILPEKPLPRRTGRIKFIK